MSSIKKSLIFIAIALFVGWLLVSFFPFGGETRVLDSDPSNSVNTYEPKFKDEGDLKFLNNKDSIIVQIDIEIADTEEDIGYGLMYRKEMAERCAMLFLMEEEKEQSFWMKNTFIPLDFVFVNKKNEIVDIAENNKALDETPVESKIPAQFILELNAGFVEKYGLKIGDKIAYTRN